MQESGFLRVTIKKTCNIAHTLMKRLLFTLLLLLQLPAGLQAQTYESLWKQAEAARHKDQPASALKAVEQVREKALLEHNDAQLLRASLGALLFKGEQSPDSAAAILQRMEKALQSEQRPVERALWHSALAQAYKQQAGPSWHPDTAATARSLRHAQAALSQPEALADASAKDFLPLFVEGKESSIFGHDLLHVLWRTHQHQLASEALATLRRIISIYAQRHLDDAVLCLSLDSLQLHFPVRQVTGALECDSLYEALQTLARQHASSLWNVRTYQSMAEMSRSETTETARLHNDSLIVGQLGQAIRTYGHSEWANPLRQRLQAMETPSASLESIPAEVYPSTKLPLRLRARHLQQVGLRLTRICDSQREARAQGSKLAKRAAKLRGRSTRQTFRLAERPAYEWQTLTDSCTCPTQPGVYYAELLGKHDEVLDTHTFSVTTLRAMVFSTPGEHHRVVVADSRSGRPVPGARITQMAYNADLRREVQAKVYEADSLGTVELSHPGLYSNFYVATPTDQAAMPFRLGYAGYGQPSAELSHLTVDLFTDRAIYRPGQRVQASMVAYARQGDQFQVEKGLQGKLLLRNANRKVVDSLLVQTDEWGSCAASLQIPASTLNGRFLLEFTNGQAIRSVCAIRVEEYRRPTFTTELQPNRTSYALGDSTQVEALVRTYTGIPVSGAKVKWQVTRTSWYHAESNIPLQTGETQSDGEGHFRIPVFLKPDVSAGNGAKRLLRHLFVVSYTVTADNGETAEGSTLLRATNRRSWLEADVPTVLCRTKGNAQPLPNFRVRLVNASGTSLDTLVSYKVLSAQGQPMSSGQVHTHQAFLPEGIAAWPIGRYSLLLQAGQEVLPDTVRFTLISDDLKRPIDQQQPLFTYEGGSAAKDSVQLLIGTPLKGVVLYRDVLAQGKLLESRRMELSDTVLHESFAYRESYDDGADIYYAFLRDGQLHTYHTSVMRPLPDMSLRMEWTSFRSRLTPGQQEVWKLKVTHPDGTPASAQVMAALYDASLDALAPQSWRFSSIALFRTHTPASWSGNGSLWTSTLSGNARTANWNTSAFYRALNDFTHWKPELFEYSYGEMESAPLTRLYASSGRASRSMKMAKRRNLAFAAPEAMNAVADRNDDLDSAVEDAGSTEGALSTVVPRSNFAETAFFRPSLHTNATGEVSIDFTLPESTTQWHFLALAHTPSMQHGTLDTMAVARKEFMVQPFMPRFVREGDQVALPVQVSNLSAGTLQTTVRVELTDALTQQCVWSKVQRITLRADEVQTVEFSCKVPKGCSLLICRAVGQAAAFSDGEEHYLPVLSSEVQVARTLPFTIRRQGTTELRIDTLLPPHAAHPSLTVEVTSNPTWTAVNALPALFSEPQALSATDWATRFFAYNVGESLAQRHPEIGLFINSQPEETSALARLHLDQLDDLTPWLQQAYAEGQRASQLRSLLDAEASAARKHTALDHLRDLQTAEGGWSWCPGMPANAYITLETALLLARTQQLALDTDSRPLTQRAMNYLKKYMAKDVDEMKRSERETKHETVPSELHLRYLYLRLLLHQTDHDAAAQFLLERARRMNHQLTMTGKARLALVLDACGQEEEARTLVQSLLEHTVMQPEMGRSFDTPRAQSSYAHYRIATQCAAIEALEHFGHEAEAEEMRLWLMQSKRTQMWETSQATTEAVYALLGKASAARVVKPLGDSQPVLFTLKNRGKTVGLNAPSDSGTAHSAGYVRRTFTDPSAVQATTLTLHQPHEGVAWGAVYASCAMPASEVSTEGQGLLLQCRHEVWNEGHWLPLRAHGVLHKGDRLRAVYTLTANRDFDFVALRSTRPACFQPRQALSGFTWEGGLSAYRDLHDASTSFFVEKLKKGSHTLTEEFFIDRTGRYASGISTLSSVYAPEFHAQCGETTFTVE